MSRRQARSRRSRRSPKTAPIERLRVAAPQVGMRQGEIAAEAIAGFLRDCGH